MRKVFRRPSPAMVVAALALIVALGGTAIAGEALSKKRVNKIITKRAPGLSVASAKSAENSGDVLWAIVSHPAIGNFSLAAAGQAGTTITEGSGIAVHFPRNIQNCAWVATHGRVPGSNDPLNAGEVSVNGVADPNAVEVRYYTSGGSLTAASFHLVVAC
jgi:hypothetical protein